MRRFYEFIIGGAAILATLTTITIWSLWALDAYGINVDGTASEKPKRETAPAAAPDDARLSLLMTLLTPDERVALRQRLEDSMAADGELSLADLLADQQQDARHRARQE